MNYHELKNNILKEIKTNHRELFEVNCDITDHPELSCEEVRSSQKLVDLLTRHGFKCEYPYGRFDTAFKAVYGSDNHKYKIALMAEYDALPDLGHACGHSLSGAISCLASIALSSLQDDLDIDIHVLGTPGEESFSCKAYMVEDGDFDGYDMAMMVHLYDANITTPKFLALSTYYYEFYGKPAHAAAAPWDGVNALNAAQLQFHAVDMMRQHLTPDARVHGIIMDGGKAANIVPDYAKTRFFIRALSRDYKDLIVEKMDKIAEGVSLATGTSWSKYTKTADAHDLILNPTGDKVLRETFLELGLEVLDEDVIFGSSDAGTVSYSCPTFHPCLKISEPPINIHMPEFEKLMKTDIAEKALDDGATIIALQVLKIFSDQNLIADMKSDFLNC